MNLLRRLTKLVYLVALLPLAASCQQPEGHRKAAPDTPKSCIVIKHLEDFDKEGKVFVISDTVELVYYSDIVVLKDRYATETYLTKVNPQDNTESTSFTGTVRDAKYTIFSKTGKTGRMFSSLSDSVGKLVKVDSLLSDRALNGAKFFVGGQKILRSVEDKKGLLVETYIPDKTANAAFPDTVIYTFDKKLNDMPYSLDPELDKLNKGKFVKIRMLFNMRSQIGNKPAAPKHEFFFEIKPGIGLSWVEYQKLFKNIANAGYMNDKLQYR